MSKHGHRSFSFREKQLSILASCMTNLSKFHVVFWSSTPNDLINSIDICDTFISDHRILTAETNIPMSPPLLSPKLNPANNVFEKLDFNKANWANLISAIKQIDWSTVLDPTSSTTCLVPFTDIISQICSLHTPIKGTKKTKKVSVFLSRTEDLNGKEDQTKKEGSYKTFHIL